MIAKLEGRFFPDRLTVGIVAHNAEEDLREVAERAFLLTGSVIVAVDRCSDRTLEVARTLQRKLGFLLLEPKESQLEAANFLRILPHVTTPWFMWMAADDRLSPESIDRVRTLVGQEADRVFAPSVHWTVPDGQPRPKAELPNLRGPRALRELIFAARVGHNSYHYGLLPNTALQNLPTLVEPWDHHLMLLVVHRVPVEGVRDFVLNRRKTPRSRYAKRIRSLPDTSVFSLPVAILRGLGLTRLPVSTLFLLRHIHLGLQR